MLDAEVQNCDPKVLRRQLVLTPTKQSIPQDTWDLKISVEAAPNKNDFIHISLS